MQDKFLTQLQTWAQAGDGDCAYKLATIYRNEGDLKSYTEWLEKSVATKNFDAMKEFAEHLRKKGEHEKATAIYKDLAKTFNDEEAMEQLVEMYERGQCNKDTLNFILEFINKQFNDIYQMKNFARVFALKTLRHNELTWETMQAIERRRIAARIRKLLSED